MWMQLRQATTTTRQKLCVRQLSLPSPSLCVRHLSAAAPRKRSRSKPSTLPPPTKIYADNHILVIDKPPGWHVVPNKEEDDKDRSSNSKSHKRKCLLTFLQNKKWGGGSKRNFLKPVHRIDQPCSGVLLLAKTTKAASRIAEVWKEKQVLKTYLCMIEPENRASLESRSRSLGTGSWKLEGFLHKRKKKPQNPDATATGWSVVVTSKNELLQQKARYVTLEWKAVRDNMLLVKTKDGARHVIRALLAQVGQCPIVGDVRYNSEVDYLPDQSVTLHARSLQLPENLQLGTTTQRYFEAPIPTAWTQFSKLIEEMTLYRRDAF